MKNQFLYISAVVISQSLSLLFHADASAQKISAGVYHSLAICSNGTVMGWGHNMFGELGSGTNGTFEHHPVEASGLTGMTAIGGGVNYSVALRNDGTAWTWGSNTEGELGNGSTAGFSNVPVQVSLISDFTFIARGMQNAVAIRIDGTVWDWGYNNFGQLGNGNNTDSNIPIEVSGLCQVTTAKAELLEPSGVSGFPNPFGNELTISGTKASGTAAIFDVNGKELIRQHTLNGESNINTSALLPGFYIFCYQDATINVNLKLIKF